MVGACAKWCLILASIYSLWMTSIDSAMIGVPGMINGKSAIERQFPYTLSLCRNRAKALHPMCCGSILTVIFTAAYCINREMIQDHLKLNGAPYRHNGNMHPINRCFNTVLNSSPSHRPLINNHHFNRLFPMAGNKRSMASSAKTITLDSMNSNILKMEYAVRGPLVIRAGEIEKEIKQVTPSTNRIHMEEYFKWASL